MEVMYCRNSNGSKPSRCRSQEAAVSTPLGTRGHCSILPVARTKNFDMPKWSLGVKIAAFVAWDESFAFVPAGFIVRIEFRIL